MGVTVKTKVTREGRNLDKLLNDLCNLEVAIGYQSGEPKRTRKGQTSTADLVDVVAFNEFGTEHSPSRPFLRQSVDNHVEEIEHFTGKAINHAIGNNLNADVVLSQIGNEMKKLVQKEIREGGFEENKKSTIKKKKSDQPLIDTAQMRQSVQYVIRKRGETKDDR